VLDADLQDPPQALHEMLQRWKEGYDVVYGVRRNRKEGLLLRTAYAGFYRLLKLVSHVDLPLDAGDFCVMDRRVVALLNAMPEHNRFVRGLRGWVGFRQIGVEYDRQGRTVGTSKYNLSRLLKLALDGLIGFSSAPLRLATWLGMAASVMGFCLLVWAIAQALFYKETPSGWASLAVMILFFGGIQLLMLGIIGEYVGRIFDEVKQRPNYVVRSRSGWAQAAGAAKNLHPEARTAHHADRPPGAEAAMGESEPIECDSGQDG
jgi:dolichol-phosphate mannosyltransferase